MRIEDVPKKVEIARRNWYETDCKGLSAAVIKDAYERGFNRAYHLMNTRDRENAIPIDWLMRYAQLPTEFAIAEWRKPKKEVLVKQAKSRDKPMSFDDALRLVDDHREATQLE